jgi:hypothetical protein
MGLLFRVNKMPISYFMYIIFILELQVILPKYLLVSFSGSLTQCNIITSVFYRLSCLVEGSCYVMNSSTWLGPLDLVVPLYGGLMPLYNCLGVCNLIVTTILYRLSCLVEGS